MKKFLLGTTTLMGAGLIAGGAMAADPIQVTVSGYWTGVTYGVVSESDSYGEGGWGHHGFDIDSDFEFKFKGKTTLDNGIVVGVEMGIDKEANSGANGSDDRINFDEVFAYVSGNFGTIQIGEAKTAADQAGYEAPNGGSAFSGNDPTFSLTNLAASTDTAATMNDKGVAVTHGATFAHPDTSADVNDGSKLVYISPRLFGLMLAFSYQPDVNGDASSLEAYQTEAGTSTNYGLEHAWTAGVDYSGEFGPVSIGAFGGFGTLNNKNGENPWIWETGTNIGFAGFTFGGSWMSTSSVDGTGEDSVGWDVGLSYETGPVKVGIAYAAGDAEYEHHTGAGGVGQHRYSLETSALTVDGSYDLGPGVTLGVGMQWASGEDELDEEAGGLSSYDGIGLGTSLNIKF